jgi:glucose/arabinose dehydrogenase
MRLLIVIVVLFLVGCSVSKVGQQAAFTANILDDLSQPLDEQEQQANFAPDVSSEAVESFFNPHSIQLELEVVADDLQMPTFVTHAGDGSHRLFVLEKFGTIRLLPEGDLFLDITDRVKTGGIDEQGLLGLAFHPRFEQNGYFYVSYTNANNDLVVSRFRLTADRQTGNPDSEYIILQQEQPSIFHNGSTVAFGPDGFLYVSLGDGAGTDDSSNDAQNPRNFLGSILRIDVDNGKPYAIPADNPFVDDPRVRPEIWAYGLRNPWRFSFDRLTDDLYIADVGKNHYEAIYFQPAGSAGGQNYGWPIVEGSHCLYDENCDTTGFTPPVAEYDHSQGCAIIGGYVYRGERYPRLQGAYLFGDHCTGRIWGLARDLEGRWVVTELFRGSWLLSSLGEDEAGEIYVTDMISGVVYRLTVHERMFDWFELQ